MLIVQQMPHPRWDEEEIVLSAISLPTRLGYDALHNNILHDEGIQTIIFDIKSHLGKHTHYSIVNDKLYYKGWLVIPSSSWTQRLISKMHCTSTGGHSGAYHTYRKMLLLSFGLVWWRWFKCLWPLVLFARNINMRFYLQQACSIPFLFPRTSGNTLLYFLSPDYQNQTGWIAS